MSQINSSQSVYVTVKHSTNAIGRGFAKAGHCGHCVAEWSRNSPFVFATFSFCRRVWRNLNRFVVALLASRAKQYQTLVSFMMICLGIGFLSKDLVCAMWKFFCPGLAEQDFVNDLANFIFSFGLCSFSNLITWEWIYANTSTSWKIFFNTGLIGGFGAFFTWMFLKQMWSYFSDWCTIMAPLNPTVDSLMFLSADVGLASVTFMYASYTVTNQSVDVWIISVSMILIFFVSFLFGMLAYLTVNILGEMSNNLWATLIVRSSSLLLRKVARWIVNKLANWGLRKIGKSFKREKFKVDLRMVVKYTLSTSAIERSSTAASTCSDNQPRAPANSDVEDTTSQKQPNRRTRKVSTSNSELSSSSLNIINEPPDEPSTRLENVVYLYVNIDKSDKRMRAEGLTSEYKTRFDIKQEIRLSPTSQ